MTAALFVYMAMSKPSFQDAQAPTEVYTNPKLGLSFSHPSTWILENPNTAGNGKNGKKGKKHKVEGDTVHFRIPLTGAAEDAELLVMATQFNGSQDTWQKVQSDANADLKRTVDRQWNQEILGVPLLLTTIEFSENGNPKTTLTGLLYNDAPSKLLFRLTGPASDFDKAQFQFMGSMQTLRTTNNALPKAQDPDHPSTPTPEIDKGAKHPLFTPTAAPKPILAPIAIPLVVSTKNVVLRVPRGWSAEHVDGSNLELRNPQLGYSLKVHLYSVLDSDSPNDALAKVSAQSLAAFGTVTVRHDTPIDTNEAGCVVTSVWRDGTNDKGRILSYDALGKSGDFYFVASGTPRSGDSLDDQKKILQKFLDLVSIEVTS